MRFELRPYQVEALNSLRQGVREGKKAQVLQMATGSGKTATASALISGAVAKGNRAYFIVDSLELVDQAAHRFISDGLPVGVIQGQHELTDFGKMVQVATIQTLARRWEYIAEHLKPSVLVVDECFTGDTEILTDEGFIRFDELGSQRVAQYSTDTSGISFVYPTRKIRRENSEPLVKFYSDNIVDLMVTPNHDMLTTNSNGEWLKIPAKELRPNAKRRIKLAGYAVGEERSLTAKEKFAICYQADGSRHHKRIAAFSFSKERKINKFLELMDDGGFRWKEVSGDCRRGEKVKPRRRFMVYLDEDVSKLLTDTFSLSKISSGLAKEIIDYMNHWDGHLCYGGSYLLTTTDKDTADFYQAVSALCGKKTKLVRVEDGRSEKFSDVYRLYITHKDETSTQYWDISREVHEGDVFCVEVPTGCIVVRRGGKVIITGNCHVLFEATKLIISECKHKGIPVIGLSATPFRKGLGQTFDSLVVGATTAQLTDMGYLVPATCYAPFVPELKGVKTKSDGDWMEDALAELMGDADIVGNVVENWLKLAEGRQTIVFAANVAHSRLLDDEFRRRGIRSAHIDGYERDPEVRTDIINRFRSGDITVLCNVGILTKGFDAPETSCVVLARPTKSLMLHIQMVGRGLRTAPGKDNCIVIDHAGNCLRNGLPTDQLPEELHDGKSTKNPDRKEREPKEPIMSPCSSCGFVSTMHKCPACGFAPQARQDVEVIDGELYEITTATKGKQFTTDERLHAYAQFLHHARATGKKDGWAYYKTQEYTGSFPHKKAGIDPIPPSIEIQGWIRHSQIKWAKSRKSA